MRTTARHWLTPHYTNNHRPKLLQPVGLLILLLVFAWSQSAVHLFKITSSWHQGLVLGFASSISAGQVAELTNKERASAGLPALQVNEQLNQAAFAKATHMFQNDYWAHVAPDGTTPWVFIKNAGYSYAVAGENLARDFGDSDSMVKAWMASPTHKENIMHKKYTQTGIAVVNGTLQGVETTLVVQLFGAPVLAKAQTLPKAVATEPAHAVTETVPAPTTDPQPVVEVAELTPMTNTQFNSALGSQTQATAKRTVSPLSLTKAIASGLIMLLVLVLVYDAMASKKHNLPRKVGNNWAHLAFFGIILVIILAMSEGSVM